MNSTKREFSFKKNFIEISYVDNKQEISQLFA